MTNRATSQLNVVSNNLTKQVTLAIVTLVLTTAAFAFCCSQSQARNGGYMGGMVLDHEQRTQLAALDSEAAALAQVPGLALNSHIGKVANNLAPRLAHTLSKPANAVPGAKAESQAQQNQIGNSAGDIARNSAINSIDYCSRYMKNFTTESGNRWNRLRDQFFLPMALLLILPGAVLTQVKAIIAQGNPVVGQSSPLEGIQRAIITIALVPATYLVVNYSIDLGNSIHYTIASEYTRIMGTDMYHDAICAEIRAFGTRSMSENEGSLRVPNQDISPRGNEPFARIEGALWGKLSDPCTGLNLVPANRDDMSMAGGALGTRMLMNLSNAGINTCWGILTAFQMAYFYYLFFVGPLMAALWCWPTKLFRDALPNWVEGVVTLAFWSFFWNVVILIIALTKSEQSTGLYIVSACNFLATAAVRHAFDFAGLLRGAASEAERMGAQAASKGGQGGGKGGSKGGSKSAGNQQQPQQQPAATPDQQPAVQPAARTMLAAMPKPKTQIIGGRLFDDQGRELDPRTNLPKVLTPSNMPGAMDPAIVVTSLPPSEVVQGNGLLQVAGLDPELTQPLDADARLPIGINQVTGTFDNPLPPMEGGPVQRARNTIASILGNAIQQVMAYPKTSIVDPDKAQQVRQEAQVEEQIEEVISATEEVSQPQIDETPAVQNLNQNPIEEIAAEESEMNPPKVTREEEPKFAFNPPPLAVADQGKSFDCTMSVSDIPLEANTCNSLLYKMADVVETFEPEAAGNLYVPQAPALPVQPMQQLEQIQKIQQAAPLSFAEELAQVYASHMPRVFAEQEVQRQTSPNYTHPIGQPPVQLQVQQQAQQAEAEEVVTVVDFTAMAPAMAPAAPAAPAQNPKQTKSGLNSLLRGRTNAPVNQDVSNSWFA